MQFTYNTDRLILRTLTRDNAPAVLEFYSRNKDIFEPWEPLHDDNFYSLNYHAYNLDAEMKLFLKHQSVRYYLFNNNNRNSSNNKIIGTVSFTNILNPPSSSCNIGYRIDRWHQHQGYAAEALRYLIPIVMKELHVFRIEANIMQPNIPSIKLIESLGFMYEGIARGSYEIRGSRTDHLRFSLISSDVF